MPAKKKPAYQLHKPTGQARVRLDGKDHYLGAFGTPESQERYKDVVTAWLRREEFGRFQLTIDEVVLLFLDFAAGYCVKNGEHTSEIHDLRSAIRPLVKLYGTSRARDFGPIKLKRVREGMIARGWCRSTINNQCHRIRRNFKWAVEIRASVQAGPSASALRRIWARRTF